MLTQVATSTVAELLQVNKLVRDVKKLKDQRYPIHAFPENEELELVTWSDAAWANRPNGVDSTEGIFVGMSTKKLRAGKEEKVTPIRWRAAKIERVCRSPAAAETMAALDAEDDATYLRILWAQMKGQISNLRKVDQCAEETPAMLVVDAKNLYDRLARATPSVKGAEKRSAI